MSTPAFHPHVPLKTDLQQNEYKVWQPTDDTTAAVMMTLAQSLLTHHEEAEPLPARWAQRAWKKHQRCSCNHHKTFTGTTLAGVHQSTWSTSWRLQLLHPQPAHVPLYYADKLLTWCMFTSSLMKADASRTWYLQTWVSLKGRGGDQTTFISIIL